MNLIAPEIAVEFVNVHKIYGSVKACSELNFKIRKGAIHAIVGENGAGKSTAMKMLFGMEKPSQGEIHISKGLQVGMVHQHFMLAEPLTALDNLILAEGGRGFEFLNSKTAHTKYSDLAKKFGFEIPLDQKVADLPVGIQQRIEILKVIASDADILILDEPTAVLTPNEVLQFFNQVKNLAALGKTILIVTHKLREVMELTTDVTVFRHGKVVAHRKTSETSPLELAELMIGQHLVDQITKKKASPSNDSTSLGNSTNLGSPLLEFQNLSTVKKWQKTPLHKINLQVKPGQIVGIAGVEGNGQNSLIDVICSGWKIHSQLEGSAKIFNEPIEKQNLLTLRKQGLAILPEDRLHLGMLEKNPAFENVYLGHFHESGCYFDQNHWKNFTATLMKDYDVRPQNTDLTMGSFSGGNQQKLVVASELAAHPKIILASHPTRGVDVGAAAFIHQKLVEQADQNNAGILVISSEIDELMKLCDLIHVLYRGQIVLTLNKSEFSEQKIGAAMGGLL